MKRILSVIMILAMLFCLAACGEDEAPSKDDKNDSISLPSAPESSLPSTPEPPAHVHDFSEPTCTTLATCQCGATKGQLAEHQWDEGDCKNNKVCGVCGAKGEFGDHKFNAYEQCVICGMGGSEELVFAALADDRLLQTTPNNTYFEDLTTYSNNYHIVFTVSAPVTDFRVLDIYEKYDEEEDYYIIETDNLYILEKLEPGKSFTVSTYINDITINRGISFVDQNGQRHDYQLELSMRGDPEDPPFYLSSIS